MNKITINGKSITVSGNNISVINGKVFVDGKEYHSEESTGEVKIVIQGNVGSIQVDNGTVEVSGDISGDVKAGGSVNCSSVGGNVSSGGSVNCDEVSGNINSGGSVNCDKVLGSITAGGSVRSK